MSQPVERSYELVLDARLVGAASGRSIAGRIEFWAQLGRAVEPLLDGSRALALVRSGRRKALSEQIGSVDSPEGWQRVADFVAERPFPRYEPAAGRPGLLTRIEADGARTVGRFVQRRFEPVED